MLCNLGKENLADISQRTHGNHFDLCNKKTATLEDPSTHKVEAEAVAFTKWSLILGLEEWYLKQNSKLHWLNVGDENNTYFHKTAKIRKMQNFIREIRNQLGEGLKTSEEIKGEAKRFFRDFLSLKPCDYQGASVDYLQQLMDF